MDNFEKFLNLGFEKIGVWEKKNGRISFFVDGDLSNTNFLYVFVVGNNILYIGKSTNTLYKRLYGYKNPGNSQRTNIRIKGYILDVLLNKKFIDIYIFSPKEIISFKGFLVNIPAGLEDTLINEFKPLWNLMGK